MIFTVQQLDELRAACIITAQDLAKFGALADLPGWRLERAVRRVARRDMLRDCRTRFRNWKAKVSA